MLIGIKKESVAELGHNDVDPKKIYVAPYI